MSPLLFLAIAIVVPLLGMIVLGVGARIKHQKVTDDETEPFRRRLESIAPPQVDKTEPSGTPGLVRAMRRRKLDRARHRAPAEAGARPDADSSAGAAAGHEPSTPASVPKPPAPVPASIRLVERDYSVPRLPPLSADLDELTPPPDQRHRPGS